MTLPTAQYKEITPEIATEMLAKNKRNYRKLSKTKVEVLARELRANQWLPTTQGVGFDTDDKLIDGQHRLSAIISTNITVPSMLVCYGLKPLAAEKIDVGNKRTFADITKLPNVVIASVRVPFRAVLSGNGRMGIVKGRPASTTDLTFMKDYLFGKIGQLNLEMAKVCTSTHGVLNVGIRAGIALSIMNGTCSEEEGLDTFNKLVDLRQNAKGVFINRSLSKRREIEATLPLLLQSLIEKIRQGLTPVYDQKTGTYTDVKETPRELATKLMFLTMQALDSTMNEEENFVSPCHATVVKTLNLK
tara:strand:- start:626 stop:1534 length:909 start_codon:yes stop_codon:yes gene_type:complete